MSLTVALLVSAGMALAGGLVSGYAQNEKDKNTQKQYELQLQQTRQTNAYNAIASASSNTLNTRMNAMNLASQLEGFNSQIDKYAMQGAQSTGSVYARSASTGFRNSGANNNALNNQVQANKFDISYLNSNVQSSMNQIGQSNISQYNQYSSSMAGYKMNIDQAVKSTNLAIENLGVADNYWFSSRMWEDAFTSAVNWGVSTSASWAGSEISASTSKKGKTQ